MKTLSERPQPEVVGDADRREGSPDPILDDLVAAAAQACGTPAAALVLVDGDRLVPAAVIGHAAPGALDGAFHAETLSSSRGMLVVEDARANACFASTPLVAEGGIRFYSGAPVLTPEGLAVGTLCVMDSSPRGLDAGAQALLRTLATAAAAHLELRRRERADSDLRDASELFRGSFDDAPVGMALSSLEDFRWLRVNRALTTLLGYTEAELLGGTFAEITHPDDVERNLEEKERLRLGQIDGLRIEKRYLRADGSAVWVDLSVSQLHDAAGNRRANIVQFIDISERKAVEAALQDSRRRLQDAQALANLGSWEWVSATDRLECSDELARILGCDAQTAPRRLGDYVARVHPEDREAFEAAVRRATEGADTETEYRVSRPDGTVAWLLGHLRALTGTDDGLRVLATTQDITRRRAAERAMREVEERFRESFERAPIGIALLVPDGSFERVNRALCDLTGYPERELLARSFREITHPHDVEADDAYVRELLAGERRSYSIEKRYLHAEGHVVWVQLDVTLVRNAEGCPQHFIAQVQDVSRRKQLERRMHEIARRDPLTDLHNRRGFEDEFGRVLAYARRYGRSGAVLMIDLDGFKGVNDTHGHKAGDELLTGLAARMTARLRRTDLIGRFGGDEFAVVLPEVSLAEAARVADELREIVQRQGREVAGAGDGPTASIGVALFDGVTGEEDLLNLADRAMYEAKQAGGDRVRIAVTPSGSHDGPERPTRRP